MCNFVTLSLLKWSLGSRIDYVSYLVTKLDSISCQNDIFYIHSSMHREVTQYESMPS